MTDPVAALAAVRAKLQAVLADARSIRDDGPRKERLATALIAAGADCGQGDEAGCKAAIADLAAVQGDVDDLKGARNDAVQRCRAAEKQALAALEAIDWSVITP